MKTLLIRLSILPRGFSVLLTLSLLSLMLLNLPEFSMAEGGDNQDDFPDRREGGGTHWVMPNMKTGSIG